MFNFIKYLVIPGAIAALGFYVLGPQIGGNPLLEAKVLPVADALGQSAPIDVPEPEGEFSSVKLDVNLTKDDRSKPDSATEVKKRNYFSPDAGKKYDEIPEGKISEKSTEPALPETPSEEPIPSETGGW
jgi:hypothetical protein